MENIKSTLFIGFGSVLVGILAGAVTYIALSATQLVYRKYISSANSAQFTITGYEDETRILVTCGKTYEFNLTDSLKVFRCDEKCPVKLNGECVKGE